jgi:hypothetical protein
VTAIAYKNTSTNLPGWVNTVHQKDPRGYAYEHAGYYLHIYGKDDGLWVLSTGLTASEKKQAATLRNWAINVFGATEIQQTRHNAGEVIQGVWRPGLYYLEQIYQALQTNENEQRAAEQAIRILIEKLDEILLYIEPSASGLSAYGHKTRELLILACTEVENLWTQYMRLANVQPNCRSFTTRDYVKLLVPLHLSEYEVSFKLFNGIAPIRPFLSWSAANPTQSLRWYDSYNKTKHDRSFHFSEATLENCLWALSSTIVMFCVRYSPYPLIEGSGSLSALFNQHFSIRLKDSDPSSFYIPLINIPADYRNDLVCGRACDYIATWNQKPLVV